MKKINVGFRNKKSKNALIAAIALSAVIATTTGNCQFASAAVVQNTSATQSISVVPNTSTTQNTIESFIIKEMEGQKFSIPAENKVMIGKTIEDQKIKVGLVDCYIDSGILMFTTHIDSMKVSNYQYAQSIKPKIYINNKLIELSNYDQSNIYNEDGKTIDILTSVDLNDLKLDMSKDLNITIDYGTIIVTNESYVDTKVTGNWKFDFTIKASQIGKLSTKEINENTTVGSNKLNVKSIKVFPTRIELTSGGDFDSTGDEELIYVIKDDKGNEYMPMSSCGSKKSMTSYYYLNTTDTKTITINPVIESDTSNSVVNSAKAITVKLK